MPDDRLLSDDESPGATASPEYVVVARRYRPQAFTELVGQQHVAEALSGAIHSHRVGHAYLFTGARGVGKTSTARIFAKALDCVEGPTDAPCNQCDICRAITSGDDVDVIEIDGASNRGIDDIRQLRQNVNVRPSRARFKIYIIDEVHMLSKDAFNALLKTLEEPPEHVKFIFCTTEPEKIPITILSRCQRFDFAGIDTPTIAERLRQIAANEGVDIETDAIDLIARRAAGSMRDGQSLLEQILAAGGTKVAVDDVQRLLGIASDARLLALVDALVRRDAATALVELDAGIRQGVDVGQLLDQLLGNLRDLMAGAVGCPASALLYVTPSRAPEVLKAGRQIGVYTLLAMLQIAEQAAARLKQTTHGRTIVELALVRICCLGELDELPAIVAQLAHAPAAAPGTPVSRPALASPPLSSASRPAEAPAVRRSEPPAASDVKKNDLSGASKPASNPAVGSAVPLPVAEQSLRLTNDEAQALWNRALGEFRDLLADHGAQCERVAFVAPNRLVATFPKKYNLSKSYCERADQTARLEQTLSAAAGGKVRVEIRLSDAPDEEVRPATARGPAPHERLREKTQLPFVRKALDLFDARAVRLEEAD